MHVSFEQWLTEVANYVFLALAIPTLVGAWMVVTSTNIVRAVLYLVVTLAGSAALFIMLGAEFVGWTVVLVYIGAVIILFLIGIMITRAPLGSHEELSHPATVKIPAALLSIVLFTVVAWAVADAFGGLIIPPDVGATRTGQLAEVIFQRFVIPFEVVSLVLLSALVGGIALARKDDPEEPA